MGKRSTAKRYLVAFIVASVLVGAVLPTPVARAAATDISGHWAETVIRDWFEQGLISGYPVRAWRWVDWLACMAKASTRWPAVRLALLR
jgi:hypothetical protein